MADKWRESSHLNWGDHTKLLQRCKTGMREVSRSRSSPPFLISKNFFQDKKPKNKKDKGHFFMSFIFQVHHFFHDVFQL